MKCWSCQKQIPKSAAFCPNCEAEVLAEASAEEEAAGASFLSAMSPDLLNEFRKAFDDSACGEDFVNRIMVGDCPQCGSSQTGDCEKDPEIDDPGVGRCFECGQLWCLDCDELFKDAQSIDHECPAWEGMEADHEIDESD